MFSGSCYPISASQVTLPPSYSKSISETNCSTQWITKWLHLFSTDTLSTFYFS